MGYIGQIHFFLKIINDFIPLLATALSFENCWPSLQLELGRVFL